MNSLWIPKKHPKPNLRKKHRTRRTGRKPQAQEDEASARQKAGKQPGAPGYGREQRLAVTAEEHHYPAYCVCCDRKLKQDAAIAHSAFETVDLELG